MTEFFFSALSFGLAAGLKPGPLGIIVIQQTLSKGLSAGVRASLAPLITDGRNYYCGTVASSSIQEY
jgi:threonine/homoserine/homoserine lactone efflux protein